MALNKAKQRRKIRYRIRKKISGTAAIPRLSVYRSNKQIYCQLIDDISNNTITSASSAEDSADDGNKIEQAKKVGELIAQRAQEADVHNVVFDRGGYIYHGRVKALAEGARAKGLVF